MREQLPNSMWKPDSRGIARMISQRLRLDTFGHRSRVIYGMIFTGSVLTLLFVLSQFGEFLPAIISGLFGGYKVGMFGILTVGAGSVLGRFWKKSPDGRNASGFEANEATPTLVLSTVRSNSAWLLIRSGKNPGQALDIGGDSVIIGSGMDSDVRIEDDSISESHAVIKEIDGMYMLSDLGTRTGTWVNGKLQSGVVLEEGNIITIGNTKMTFLQTSSKVKNNDIEEPQIIGATLFVRAGSNSGKSFQIGIGDTVIGNDPTASNIKLDDPAVSKRHAKIRVMSKVCRLYDLGSTNGTDVDGTKLDGVTLRDGDVIKFGKVEVRFVRESMR